MFEHDRTPDKNWEARLAELAPPGTRLPWLKIVWMPGEAYDPVQRWAIYEIFPDLAAINPGLVQEFYKDPPRSRGEWVDGRWRSESLVSRLQYDLFHKCKGYPQLTWIIQGDEGGHQWCLSRVEEALFRMLSPSLTMEWPRPGELPYAEFNEKTFVALLNRDKLRKQNDRFDDWECRYKKDGVLDVERAGRTAQEILREEEIELNSAVEKWLKEQFYGVQQLLTHSMVAEAMEDAPVTGDWTPGEEIEREFIEGT